MQNEAHHYQNIQERLILFEIEIKVYRTLISVLGGVCISLSCGFVVCMSFDSSSARWTPTLSGKSRDVDEHVKNQYEYHMSQDHCLI